MDLTQADAFSFDWSYPGAFIWGLAVLISLVGWGQAVGGWLVTPDENEQPWGWSLAAAWGMAAFLVLSGPLIMLSLFSLTFIVLFLLAGWISAARHARFLWKHSLCAWPGNWGLKALLMALLLIVALTYAGAVAAHWYNSCDDFSVYFAHTKMLLDTGTLHDPFGMRLMLSLGGQQTLSTLILAFFPWKYAHLLDMGVAGLIALGLAQEMIRGGGNKAWMARLMLIALALTCPVPRINITSELTSVVLFLAFYLSFDLVSTRRCTGWRSALLLGGVVMATATLRGHCIFAVALLGMGFVLWRLWEGEQGRKEIVRESAMTFITALILLAPWWIVTYRSGGSFLYPLIKGNEQPGFQTMDLHLPLLAKLQFIGGFFISTTYVLLFLPIFFVEGGRRIRALLIYLGAILLLSAAFVSQLTDATEYFNINRYLVPIWLPFGLYSAGMVARQLVEKSPSSGSALAALRGIFAVMVATLVLFFQSFGFWDLSFQNIFFIRWAIDARNEFSAYAEPVSSKEAAREYGEAFAQIPPGGKTLIALDYPFLVDYRKHSISSIDFPGAVSPKPGLPYFNGPGPVKKYLLDHGIRYVAHVPFDHSEFLYSRDKEHENLVGPSLVYRFYSKLELDFFDNIDQLAKSNRILYDSPTIRVIDLDDGLSQITR